MEKKYFYVDNLLIYGRELYKKECFRLKFINIEEGVYCLYDSKKRKIALSWKHPKDKEDWAIAFAICYHKLYGLPEPKTKNEMKKETAQDLKYVVAMVEMVIFYMNSPKKIMEIFLD